MSNLWFDEFDPNEPANDANIFGLPCDEKNSQVILIPVPWEVTVSYGKGTASGPGIILRASKQIDLYQQDIFKAWQLGIYYLPIDQKIHTLSSRLLTKFKALLGEQKQGRLRKKADWLSEVNSSCAVLNQFIEDNCIKYLNQDKIVGIIGGDHSTPIGLIRALAGKNSAFAVLQIDAHADLRVQYEGFEHSHASIMHNVLKLPGVNRLIQVGVRDYCEEEAEKMQQDERITSFTQDAIVTRMFNGDSWGKIVDEIVDKLPDKVYVSFDIDGLDPALCPGTGTPVPGGLTYDQAMYLLKRVAISGRTIIGFDLCEVSAGTGDGEWDGNVGARILYRLTNLTAASQGKILFN
jgi:agmatinase